MILISGLKLVKFALKFRNFLKFLTPEGTLVQYIKIKLTKYWQLLFQSLAKHGHFKNYWLYKQSNLP